jgi:predicted esterase YcpF (UPF0227 family)
MKVIFSHGKESGPWGSKIKYLANTADALGFEVDSIDYAGMLDPDERVKKLLNYISNENEDFILVGSSMGAYVSLVAAQTVSPLATFLLAPALYIDGYKQQEYSNSIANLEIVHGWSDEIIPIQNSVQYAQQAHCTLHLIDGDHRLNTSLEHVNDLFALFLARFLKP